MSPASLPSEHPILPASGCPTEDDLLAFIPGLLPDESAAVVAAHLQTCGVCQSRVTTLKRRMSSENGNSPGGRRREATSDSTIALTTYQARRPAFPKKLGQYDLQHAIGRGGMGVVFKAMHPRLHRHVAIKLLPGLQLSEQTAIVRLQRETAAAGKVEHENVVYAFDAGEQDGIDYLVMEFVEGIDASRLVAAFGPLSIADACEVARQAALGLAHIESRGLVHRDIKPSNLMISAEGVVKILDLGLARLREGRWDDAEATHSGYLLGTADYVAPEQIDRPRDADSRSDLYSLGCTLYRLLSGQAPFGDADHGSVGRKLDAHRRHAPPPLRELRPDVPPAVDLLVTRLLAKEPAERPQRASEVAELLREFAEGANLKSLVDRAAAELPDDRVTPDAASYATPPTPFGSTHGQGGTPTPRAIAAAASRPWRWAGGIALASLAVAGVVLAAALAANGRKADRPAEGAATVERNRLNDTAQPISGSGRTVFDLQKPLAELKWEGHISSPPPFFNDNHQMLEVRPDSFQLLAVGQYDGQPGAFEVTIRQSPWHGDAGLFFGYRHEPQPGYKQIAMFQTVRLWHYPIANERGERVRNELQLVRERALLRLNPLYRDEEDFVCEMAPYPQTHQVRLRIEFDEKKIARISLDGVELPTLSTAAVNARYRAADSVGIWGIYAAASENDMGPTWFGNLEFTPAEKSP